MKLPIDIDPSGTVVDTLTGAAYGRIVRARQGWDATTIPAPGNPVITINRSGRWEAAIAIVGMAVLGYEGEAA